MKLNPDCLRDVLLYLEENLTIDVENKLFNSIDFKTISEYFNDCYSKEDLWYSVYNLKEVRFIEGKISNVESYQMFMCNIENITWSGHQFLNNIRPNNIWDATKSGAKKLGTMSISALTMISSEITKVIVTKPEVIQKIVDGFISL